MIPTFAVVGQPNKGKSSIVATLAEDERIAIAPTPGTTRNAHHYTLSIDGEPQYVLVDTPGFQRARAVLDWLPFRYMLAFPVETLIGDLDRSAAFYDSMLAPLGWRRHFEQDQTIGWGIAKPVFFVSGKHDPQPGFGPRQCLCRRPRRRDR